MYSNRLNVNTGTNEGVKSLTSFGWNCFSKNDDLWTSIKEKLFGQDQQYYSFIEMKNIQISKVDSGVTINRNNRQFLEFIVSQNAMISDVRFKGIFDSLSQIGGTFISITTMLSLMFSLSIFNEWEWSLVNSITDDPDQAKKRRWF